MNFKPGDKVWIDNQFATMYPIGTYAGVLVRVMPFVIGYGDGWWQVDAEGIEGEMPNGDVCAHETILCRRDDPPPQQEPKREATGDWDLCPWRPVSVPKEVA